MAKKSSTAKTKTAAASAKKPRATKKTVSKSTKTTTAAKTSSVKAVKNTTKTKVSATRAAAGNNIVSKLSLNAWHQILAIVYLLQGIAILILSAAYSLPVTVNFLAKDPLADDSSTLAPATEYLFDINIVYLLAAMLFVAALTHGVLATIYKDAHERDLKARVNRMKWAGLGVAGGLATIIVALLVGVHSITLLILLFAFVLLASLGLIAAELARGKKQADSLVFGIAITTMVLPWLALGCYVGSAWLYGATTLAVATYAIFASVLVIFAGIVINSLLQRRAKGRWSNYLFGESISIVLILLATSALAWQVFAAVLR